ncbi:SnoaL-like protein [Actinocorallia herbida]|uniref:SnoaL-like protein n=1 Tax=Actinocorallia herbida TaxID=58109 RepID=A0A3N1CZJ7_9ACTN|nr:nuclear transport factor 2 family protein [Actinocorallia herbida]ROO86697.1 SnoaL-like protein [Actinocorallia herbida]
MSGDLETRLRELVDEHDIREVVLRYARAQERHDRELLSTVFHPDGIYEHYEMEPYRINGDLAGFLDFVVQAWAAAPITSKGLMVPSTYVELEGDIAFADSSALSLNPVNQNGVRHDYLRSLRFLDRFERRDGRWRIAHRLVVSGGYERWEPAAPSPFTGIASPDLASGYHPDDLWYTLRDRLRPGSVAERTIQEKPVYLQEEAR